MSKRNRKRGKKESYQAIENVEQFTLAFFESICISKTLIYAEMVPFRFVHADMRAIECNRALNIT